MNKVVLTKLEGQWMARNILKSLVILRAASQKDQEVLSRKTYKTLAGLEDQAKQIDSALAQLKEEPFELELQVNPKQKDVVKFMIGNTITLLEEKILPEYKRREDAERTNETMEKIELLKTMRRKFK